MKPHKRKGREARIRRQQSAAKRRQENREYWEVVSRATPEEQLLYAIFGMKPPKPSDYI